MTDDSSDTFYITTSIPYVNGDPHIGFAMELLQADVLARYARQRGDSVIFSTGCDEHGTKVAEKAAELGKTPQAFTDEISQKFRDLGKLKMPEAQIVLGAAVIDDVLGLVILAVVSSLVEAGTVSVAEVLEIDAVIDPMETRAWLLRGLKSCPVEPRPDRRRFVDVW